MGTSVGLFAEGRPADFDLFICKDGFSPLEPAGYSNFYGVEKLSSGVGKVVSNTSSYGGWFMISGVSLGEDKGKAAAVEVIASSLRSGKLEIWLDDLQTGRMIASIPLRPTGGADKWMTYEVSLKNISGSHDLFVKFPPGSDHEIYVKQILFKRNKNIGL